MKMPQSVICNPLNLDYKYQEISTGDIQNVIFRESADPTVVLFHNRYLLFSSMTGGFWWSDDLVTWEFVERRELPIYDYAPDVREINGYLYFSASSNINACSLYRSKDPINEPFEEVTELFPFWDPHLFCDDDGSIFLYWGCSNKEPIYGTQLDNDTFQPVSEKIPLVEADTENHGWERTGVNNDPNWFEDEYARMVSDHVGTEPFIEGAFMNKYEGKYYLQYAAPATERNTYADGVYIGEGPLGPFTYCNHSPFSSKPGGFITGAGHGSTFKDKFGNWWHAATMRVGINHTMERRIGIFPAGFDKDGILFCNQNFADYPMEIPSHKEDPQKIGPKFMLLSHNKPVHASSETDNFPASNITNEDIRSIWMANTNTPGENLYVDLGELMKVSAIQLNFSDFQIPFIKRDESEYFRNRHSKRFINMNSGNIRYYLEGSPRLNDWEMIVDKSETDQSLCNDFILLDIEKKYQYIRLTILEMPYNQNFTLSDMRIFGIGNGMCPGEITPNLRLEDNNSMIISWEKQNDANGYNIRYGIEPEKLYNSWLIYDQSSITLKGLNKGQKYYVAVDAFNENGVTCGKVESLSE